MRVPSNSNFLRIFERRVVNRSSTTKKVAWLLNINQHPSINDDDNQPLRMAMAAAPSKDDINEQVTELTLACGDFFRVCY
jgi:hypothetical protein